MEKDEIENLEIELLIKAVYMRYGYDFRQYAKASIKRGIKRFLSKMNYGKVTELLAQLLYDETLFESFIYSLSITVTEMFRDPSVYKVIREKVIPFLKTYPYIKIWHAGSSTGEEVYSMAILLKEEGVYDRAQIYATDFNDIALKKASEGIYSIERIKEHTANYQKSGGKRAFSEYYHSEYHSVIMNRSLKENITFANHNLVTDSVFGEMHFIICRNVLIYFNRPLQNRVLNLFNDSLVFNGFLCLGSKERLRFSEVYKNFQKIVHNERIYRKKGEINNLDLKTE